MEISIVQFIILTLATYRLSRLIVEDTVTEPLRDAIWNRFNPSQGIGYLITCYWCTSFWVASLLVLMFIIVPVPTTAMALILALSSMVGIISARMDQ
jgi:hypothetical protein